MSWTVEDCEQTRDLLAQHSLNDPERLLRRESPSQFRVDDTTFTLCHGNGRGGLLRKLRGRPAAGLGLYQQLTALTEQDIPCARPVFFAQQRLAGLPGRWVLLAEVPCGSQPLGAFLHNQIGPSLPGRRERRRLLTDLANLLRAVGQSGWANPGLEPRAILVNGWPGAFRFVFVGSPRAHPVDGPVALSDELVLALASLSRGKFSTQEVLRFLRTCSGESSLKQTQNRLARRVLRALR